MKHANQAARIVCAVWLVSGYIAVRATVAGVGELVKRGPQE